MKKSILSALATPFGLDSLSQLVFAGDNIVVVPDAYFAERPDILKEIAESLVQSGVLPVNVQILLTEDDEKNAEKWGETGLNLLFHRPGRRDRLALLGTSTSGDPIALCRDLVDADVVMPLERYFDKKPKGYYGIFSAIFPRMSDAATIHRFQTATANRSKLKSEVAEAANLLGIHFSIQVTKNRALAGLTENILEELRDLGS